MRRGQVVVVRLDPAEPGEASKRRPCVIVSNEGANSAATKYGRGTITIVPVTSNTTKIHADFHVPVEHPDDLSSMGLSTVSKIQAEQVRTIAMHRVGTVIGWAPTLIMRQVDAALRFHLSL